MDTQFNVIYPDFTHEVLDLGEPDQSQGHFQKAVGGELEVIHLCGDVAIYANTDGRDLGLPLNFPVALVWEAQVYGPVVTIDPRPDAEGDTLHVQHCCRHFHRLDRLLARVRNVRERTEPDMFDVVGIFIYDPSSDTLNPFVHDGSGPDVDPATGDEAETFNHG